MLTGVICVSLSLLEGVGHFLNTMGVDSNGFQKLADGVIPNEYGINPQHKLTIGAKVCNVTCMLYSPLILLRRQECVIFSSDIWYFLIEFSLFSIALQVSQTLHPSSIAWGIPS